MELKIYTTDERIIPLDFSTHGFGYSIQQGAISINDPWTSIHTYEEKHFLHNVYINTIKDLDIRRIEVIDGENEYILNNITNTYFQVLYVNDYACDSIYFKHKQG